MLEPTSGRVTIQGFDNQSQIEEVRHHLGFCPQYGSEIINIELFFSNCCYRYSLQ